MRGYSHLKTTGGLDLLRQIKTDLVDEVLSGSTANAAPHVFGASLAPAEILVRQLLIQRFAGAALTEAILYALEKKGAGLVYPMPKAWQRVFSRHGFRVDGVKSSFLWAGRVASYWAYGVLVVARIAVFALWTTLLKRTDQERSYAYFEGLTASNLPQPGADGLSYDICTWYSKWSGRASNVESICHSVADAKTTTLEGVPLGYIGRPFELLRGVVRTVGLLGWGVKAVAIVAADVLKGRWWNAIVLAEAAKAKAVQLCAPGVLATEYLFHYSGSVYRPMWTYEAAQKGARILCYFYTTYEQIKLPEGYVFQRYDWGAATWPQYLVWDQYQSEVIRREIDKYANIEVVGPIWFSTSAVELPLLPEKSIAVFDIQPIRKAVHFGFSSLSDFVAKYPDVQIQFVRDIHMVLSECGVTMAFKTKRELGSRGVKGYQVLIEELSHKADVVIVAPSTSAIRVIAGCKGCISMPFTATAIYSRDQGVPSVYYDPTGWIQKDDRGAHGVRILSGIDELRLWVDSVFGKSLSG